MFLLEKHQIGFNGLCLEGDKEMKIYYHYFEDKKYNCWLRGRYERFLGQETKKIKLFKIITVYKKE